MELGGSAARTLAKCTTARECFSRSMSVYGLGSER